MGASGIDAAQGEGGRGREGGGRLESERENGRLRATDRKGAITASQDTVKKDHGHGFAFVSLNIL